jgi:hypothetical protein
MRGGSRIALRTIKLQRQWWCKKGNKRECPAVGRFRDIAYVDGPNVADLLERKEDELTGLSISHVLL